MALTKISTGEMRHYLTFEAKSAAPVDEHGQRALTWSEVRSLWAKLEVKQASEVMEGDRKVQVSNFIFTLRYVDGLNSTMRILYRARYYSINAIYDKDGTGKWLTIEARLDDSNNNSGGVI